MTSPAPAPAAVRDPPRDVPTAASQARLLVVTGMSGAGRSTALKALEDLGYEAVDNLPLSLVPGLMNHRPRLAPLALGADVRTRDFGVGELAETVSGWSGASYGRCGSVPIWLSILVPSAHPSLSAFFMSTLHSIARREWRFQSCPFPIAMVCHAMPT